MKKWRACFSQIVFIIFDPHITLTMLTVRIFGLFMTHNKTQSDPLIGWREDRCFMIIPDRLDGPKQPSTSLHSRFLHSVPKGQMATTGFAMM